MDEDQVRFDEPEDSLKELCIECSIGCGEDPGDEINL
jgi:hypothetical protein